MGVLMLTVLVTLVLVAGGVLLFIHRLRAGDFDHGERLSLLPLEEDEIVEQPEGDAPGRSE